MYDSLWRVTKAQATALLASQDIEALFSKSGACYAIMDPAKEQGRVPSDDEFAAMIATSQDVSLRVAAREQRKKPSGLKEVKGAVATKTSGFNKGGGAGAVRSSARLRGRSDRQ